MNDEHARFRQGLQPDIELAVSHGCPETGA